MDLYVPTSEDVFTNRAWLCTHTGSSRVQGHTLPGLHETPCQAKQIKSKLHFSLENLGGLCWIECHGDFISRSFREFTVQHTGTYVWQFLSASGPLRLRGTWLHNGFYFVKSSDLFSKMLRHGSDRKISQRKEVLLCLWTCMDWVFYKQLCISRHNHWKECNLF